MDRALSAPLPAQRAARGQAFHDTEKENAGAQPKAPAGAMRRAASGAAPKPPRMRRTRSELHGPCCHCHATGAHCRGGQTAGWITQQIVARALLPLPCHRRVQRGWSWHLAA